MSAIEELEFLDPVEVRDDELMSETQYFRVTNTIVYPADVTVQEQMNLVEASGALDFWNDPAEDIYTESTGDAT